MSDSTQSKDKTVQTLSGLTIMFIQVIFMISLSYWYGFSAVSGISVVRGFTVLQVFTSTPNQVLGSLIVFILFVAVSQVISYASAKKTVGFIHDPLVILPDNAVTNNNKAELSGGKRYMTDNEFRYFRSWVFYNRYAGIASFCSMILFALIMVYFWVNGEISQAIRISIIISTFIGIITATSKTLAFISLPIRNVLTSILLVCCVFASSGARDAENLLQRGESASFPMVVISISKYSLNGHLVAQLANEILFMDNLRQFILIPNTRVEEVRYAPN